LPTATLAPRAERGLPRMPRALARYALAAGAEIAGCSAFWAWLRLGRSGWRVAPVLASLIAFAWVLTGIEAPFAGRAYAAYGGVYIAASLPWLWLVEQTRPDRWDAIGAGLCLASALLILLGPRASG
jgi:small multidrug resistance family-3 protein